MDLSGEVDFRKTIDEELIEYLTAASERTYGKGEFALRDPGVVAARHELLRRMAGEILSEE